MQNYNVIIREASLYDVPQVKQLADNYKNELGFVTQQSFIEAVERKDLIVAEFGSYIIGFQQFRTLKRVPQITLYKKAVMMEYRRQGIATLMVDYLIELAKNRKVKVLKLKCIVGLPSNKFHLNYGFKFFDIEEGKLRPLNVYVLNI